MAIQPGNQPSVPPPPPPSGAPHYWVSQDGTTYGTIQSTNSQAWTLDWTEDTGTCPHDVCSVDKGLAGSLIVQCDICEARMTIGKLPLSFYRDQAIALAQQIIDTSDPDSINALYCELKILLDEVDELREEILSLKELTDALSRQADVA